MDKFIDIAIVALAMFFLIKGAEWILTAAVAIAEKLKISKLVIASTLIAFGTGLPTIAVNIALILLSKEGAEAAVGNALGTNFVNIGLGLGIPALLLTLKMKYQVFEKEIPIFLGMTALLTSFLMDGVLTRLEGFAMFSIYIVVLIIIYQYSYREKLLKGDKKQVDLDTSTLSSISVEGMSFNKIYFKLAIGFVSLIICSLVIGYMTPILSGDFHISEYILGLTVIGIGTSIPMIVTSIRSSLKGYVDIIIGNVFGSTIANIALGLGVAAMILPLSISQEGLSDMYYFNILNIIVIVGLLVEMKLLGENKILNKVSGIVIILFYLIYLAVKFI
ncbi:MAG: sodium:calcium antiporter [Candidatus Dojkabacteria bacterium]